MILQSSGFLKVYLSPPVPAVPFVSRKRGQELANAFDALISRYTALCWGVQIDLERLERLVTTVGHDQRHVVSAGFHHVSDKGVAETVASKAVGSAIVQIH